MYQFDLVSFISESSISHLLLHPILCSFLGCWPASQAAISVLNTHGSAAFLFNNNLLLPGLLQMPPPPFSYGRTNQISLNSSRLLSTK
jgi:hypothetical protein